MLFPYVCVKVSSKNKSAWVSFSQISPLNSKKKKISLHLSFEGKENSTVLQTFLLQIYGTYTYTGKEARLAFTKYSWRRRIWIFV